MRSWSSSRRAEKPRWPSRERGSRGGEDGGGISSDRRGHLLAQSASLPISLPASLPARCLAAETGSEEGPNARRREVESSSPTSPAQRLEGSSPPPLLRAWLRAPPRNLGSERPPRPSLRRPSFSAVRRGAASEGERTSDSEELDWDLGKLAAWEAGDGATVPSPLGAGEGLSRLAGTEEAEKSRDPTIQPASDAPEATCLSLPEESALLPDFEARVPGLLPDFEARVPGLLPDSEARVPALLPASSAQRPASFSSAPRPASSSSTPPPIWHPSLPYSQRNAPLLAVLPRFFGTRQTGGRQLLALEDLTRGYARPCIMDAKIGFRTWYAESGDAAYVARCRAKDATTTQAALGFKVCGMQVWRAGLGGYWRASKRWCKTLGRAQVDSALFSWAQGSGAGLSAADVLGGPEGAVAQLQALERWVRQQRELKFYSSSVLLLYEGAAQAAGQARVRVRLVDFAHTFHDPAGGARDLNFLAGLRSLVARLKRVARMRIQEAEGVDGQGVD
ncbi:inositol polyphosphate kinase, partial [Helicosporidium sp. ATCC 50920]